MAQFRTMEQIQSEANATLDEDLQRTERMKRLVQDDRETNAKTLEELDRQGDALRRIEGHVDGIHASNVEARGHISHMEKWCGLFRCKKYVQPDYIFVHSKTHCCSSLFDVSNCVLVYLTTTSKRTNPLTWIHIHTSNKATFAVSGLFLTRSRPILGCRKKPSRDVDYPSDGGAQVEMQPRTAGGKGQAAASGAASDQYIRPIVGDDREKEMNGNLRVVHDVLGDLRQQAEMMGDELEDQNARLDRINAKTTAATSEVKQNTRRTTALM
eukprot:m.82195 g.82195  ORF g.82195 m.82195 type:complete len:269 (+) comp12677_c0_seq3:112-918(+)